jgi:hypothetical protein
MVMIHLCCSLYVQGIGHAHSVTHEPPKLPTQCLTTHMLLCCCNRPASRVKGRKAAAASSEDDDDDQQDVADVTANVAIALSALADQVSAVISN